MLARGPEISENHVDALLVDGAQASIGKTHADPAVFALDPEAPVLQIRQETTLGLLLAWETLLPTIGFLPVTMQTRATGLLHKVRDVTQLYSTGRRFTQPPLADVPPGGHSPKLQNAALRERHRGAPTDDNMIQDPDVHQRQGLLERLR